MMIGGLAILAAAKAIPWGTIARVGILAAVVLAPVGAAAWFGYQLGYAAGAGDLLERSAEFERAVAARDLVLDQVRGDLADNAARLASAQSLYDALRDRPPAVIIRYRDAAPAAGEVITSEPCEQAVGETLEFVRALAALEERGNP